MVSNPYIENENIFFWTSVVDSEQRTLRIKIGRMRARANDRCVFIGIRLQYKIYNKIHMFIFSRFQWGMHTRANGDESQPEI